MSRSRDRGVAAAAAGVRGVAAAAAVLALGVAGCTSPPADQAPAFSMAPTPTAVRPAAGCDAIATAATAAAGGLPDMPLPCLGTGAPVSLAHLRGPAVVNVWGTWCGDCVAELPVLARFAAAEPGVAVLGVDYGDHDRAAAVAELSTSGVRYPNVRDVHQQIAVAGVPTVPTTFLIDASGRVVFRRIVPYGSVAAVRADVARYLNAPES